MNTVRSDVQGRAVLAASIAVTAFSILLGGAANAQAQSRAASEAQALRPDVRVRSTPDNLVWGGFPIGQQPTATVRSGQTVRIDTLSHAGVTNSTLDPAAYLGAFGVQEGEILQDAFDFWDTLSSRPRYGGGHVLTGPVYVEGAEPGDTLEVQILKVRPRVPYGINSTSPTSGVFSLTYPGWREGDMPLAIPEPDPHAPGGLSPGVRQHLYRTGRSRGRDVAFFSRDIQVPTYPFMGIMATAPRTGVFVGRNPNDPPPPLGVQTSTAPGEYGGNLDVKDLGSGSTLYLPVFQPGAQFFTGDGHSVQGDGEVSGTAIEQSLAGTFRFILHKRTTATPSAQDPDYEMLFGIDHDLDRAMKFAVGNVVKFLVEQKGLTTAKAYSLASIAVDFVNSEVVDGTQVVTGKIPKSLFEGGRFNGSGRP